MPNPKSLVHHLYVHWDLVEFLVQASRDLPTLDQDQIIAAVGKIKPDMPQEDRAGVLRSLCNSDILRVLPRSSSLEFNPLVLEFVRGLTRENELGLSSVLQARVEAVRTATHDLNEGIETSDIDLLRTASVRLKELFRQISLQLEQDRHAIQEIAEQAKSTDSSMPIARRYRAVLNAYEQYVEPVNQMMDSGPSGTFYHHLEAAEKALDHAAEQMAIQNALYTHRLQLRIVAYQAKELRRHGRIAVQQCADILLPLREEYRQHSELTSAISKLLGQVRKKGLNRALRPRPNLYSRIPLWRTERFRRISVGDEVLTIMGEARNYSPASQSFPDELNADQAAVEAWVDEQKLRNQLRESLPVANLLEWLQLGYGHLSDSVLLRLYHELVRSEEWLCTQIDFPVTTNLNQIRVLHYPHRLTRR